MEKQDRILFKKGQDKSQLFETFAPSARFEIPSSYTGYDYIDWLTGFFQQFIRELSDNRMNWFTADSFRFEPVGREGGVGNLFIGDMYFEYCKVFVYTDGIRDNFSNWKGIWLRNHMDQSHYLEGLYELAEHFEMYLQKFEINYTRFGRFSEKLDRPGDCVQFTEP